jgi:hypothetical protein
VSPPVRMLEFADRRPHLAEQFADHIVRRGDGRTVLRSVQIILLAVGDETESIAAF